MTNSNYTLELLVNGRPAQEYAHLGKTFVEAREGTEYSLRFRNNSWNRVMAVFSVDGVDVLHGKTAGETDTGYVVNARSFVDIKGYRISDQTVAAFRFLGGKQSYAATVGGATKSGDQRKTEINNGVIGVRVYEEIFPYWTTWTTSNGTSTNCTCNNFPVFPTISLADASGVSLETLSSLCLASGYSPTSSTISASNSIPLTGSRCNYSESQPPKFDLGTSWGGKVEDHVTTTTFQRSEVKTDLTLYYASRKVLEDYGIDFSKTKKIVSWPQAFDGGFCKAPPGYAV